MSSKKEQTKSITPLNEVRGVLIKMSPEFKKALPSQIPTERFTRVLDTVLVNKPDLVSCNRQSLYAACMAAAQDGLLPDGREGAIVPYKGEAKWLPMVRGIIKKVQNSGELAALNPGVVYANDDFQYWVDEFGPHIKHMPTLTNEKGEITHFYCSAQVKNSHSPYLEVMSKAEVDKVRAMSKAKSGPWFDWYEEMGKKTVIRRLGKRLPISSDLQRLFESNDDINPIKEVAEIKQEKTKSSKLSKIIEESEGPEEKTVIKKTAKGFKSEEKNEEVSPDEGQEDFNFDPDYDKETQF